MRKRTFLGIVFLLSLAPPLHELFFTFPSYERLLLQDTQQEAARYVAVLLHSLDIDRQPLARETIAPHVDRELERLQRDFHLVKLRFFSPQGEIIYSTARGEVGTVNQKSYFHEIVRQGQTFSKVVKKDLPTAEGASYSIDVVETYVPLMLQGTFGGAIETYFDITSRMESLQRLHRRSLLLQLAIGLGLLALIVAALGKIRETMRRREKAEAALKRANLNLEDRVAERTGQLEDSCRKLKEEVVERIVVQDLLSETVGVLQGEKDRINGILRSVGDGLLVVDEADRVTLMNPAAEDLLGCRFCIVGGGVPLESLVTNGVLLDYLNLLLRRRAGQKNEDFELPALAGKPLRVLQGRTSELIGPDGRGAGKVVLIQDVTEDRSIERMKREFISMATHELQTPLATMIGYAELLTSEGAERFTPEERKGFCLSIHEKGFALSRIVDDLVDASLVDSGQVLSVSKAPFSLNSLVQQAVSRFFIDSKRHRIALDCCPEPIEVAGDGGRIEQVLGNLLSNAVKYSPQGGEVKIATERVDGFAQVCVSDEGIGMTSEQASMVFNRFYRVDSSTTAVGGVGLGLSIARDIVDAHGGRIWVESEPGRGTAVYFTLPLAAARANEPVQAVA